MTGSMPGNSSESVLRFEDVTLRFDDEATALERVSFALDAGESCVVLGAAGSGKTVLLKTALGLLRADEGRVYLFGEEISRAPERDLVGLRSKVGMLFQEGGLFDSLTIEENVEYPLVNQRAIRCSPWEARPRVEEALEFVELEHTLDKFPSELSGGMRRRVGIARANVTEPPLVLYDSPTAGLDPITAHTIMVTHRYQDGHLLANYRYNAKTGRLEPATSNGSENELRTKFMVLRAGRLVFQGTQQELEASPDSYVRQFVKRLTD